MLTGGCLCGGIRYECQAEPIAAVLCHCRTCQKFHAAPYAACAMMPAGAIALVAGEPARYEVIGDSGAVVYREFCNRCGSQLFAGSSGYPQSKTVKIASLDDPGVIRPIAHLHTENRIPWVCIDDGLPRYPKQVDSLAELQGLWVHSRTGAAPEG